MLHVCSQMESGTSDATAGCSPRSSRWYLFSPPSSQIRSMYATALETPPSVSSCSLFLQYLDSCIKSSPASTSVSHTKAKRRPASNTSLTRRAGWTWTSPKPFAHWVSSFCHSVFLAFPSAYNRSGHSVWRKIHAARTLSSPTRACTTRYLALASSGSSSRQVLAASKAGPCMLSFMYVAAMFRLRVTASPPAFRAAVYLRRASP
mmetsp:Transcript_57289/g.102387  ORF Transcript_57289/g.102387 Transcript_57289/m.102387 type:complete len:205 (-) Transcript_57289:52-666(-)